MVTADEATNRKRRIRRAGAVVLVVVIVAALPQFRTRVRAAVTLADALGVPVPRPFAADVVPERAAFDGVDGRLYDSGDRPLLIVPGAAAAGVEDARVNSVAAALARSGHRVFIPELDLYGEKLTEADLERIVAAVTELARQSSGPVTVLGISYGGALSLIAAADDRLEGKIGRLATFGAYFDLRGLIQAITTGRSLVDGEIIPWDGHPLARSVLEARIASLLPEPERTDLIEALGGDVSRGDLGESSQAVFDLLSNQDPARTYELADAVPPEVRDFLIRFSPSTTAGQIPMPVAALHSTDDPLVPYGELRRLHESLPDARVTTVGLFEHVDFDANSPGEWLAVAPDLLRLWGYTTWLMSG